MSVRIGAIAGLLALALLAPTAHAAGMRDCVERGGVWLESGQCESPNDDAAARCHGQGGRWLSSSGRCEMPTVDPDEACKKRGGIGVHDGKCYRLRTRDDRE
jgi:hypothetical protein